MRKLLIAALVVAVLGVSLLALIAQRLLDREAVRAAVEGQATRALAQPVRIGGLDWELSARPRVVLTEVSIGEPAAIRLQRVEVTTGLRALFSKRVEQAGLVVSGSQVQLPLPFSLFAGGAGAASATTSAADDAAAAFAIVSVDRLALRDITLQVGQSRLVLDLESSLQGRRLAISQVRLRSEHSTVEGTGDLPDVGVLRGALALKAESLDLDELLAVASGISASGAGPSAPGSREASGTAGGATPLDLRVDLTAARGRALGQEFTDLSTRLAVTRAGVVLDPLGLRLLDGRLDGQLRVDTSGPTTVVSVAGQIDGMDVAKLAALAGSAGAITGRLSGQVRLQAPADASGAMLRAARGTATLSIADGAVPGLDLVRPVITAFGTSGQVGEGDRSFSRLGGSFALADGVLGSDDLALASRDVDLEGRGTVSWPI